MKTKHFLFIACAIMACQDASADRLMKATAKSQVQINRDEKGFYACGIRVVAHIDFREDTQFNDFSVYFSANPPFGFVKFASWSVSASDLVKGKLQYSPNNVRPDTFWIARSSQSKAVAAQSVIPAETKGYSLATADPSMTPEIIMAVASGESMQFSIRRNGDKNEVTGMFSSPAQSDEIQSLQACFASVGKRIESQIKE